MAGVFSCATRQPHLFAPQNRWLLRKGLTLFKLYAVFSPLLINSKCTEIMGIAKFMNLSWKNIQVLLKKEREKFQSTKWVKIQRKIIRKSFPIHSFHPAGDMKLWTASPGMRLQFKLIWLYLENGREKERKSEWGRKMSPPFNYVAVSWISAIRSSISAKQFIADCEIADSLSRLRLISIWPNGKVSPIFIFANKMSKMYFYIASKWIRFRCVFLFVSVHQIAKWFLLLLLHKRFTVLLVV